MTELELLAGAIAGRSVPLERSRRGVHSDGLAIFLGADVDQGSDHARRAVMMQAALIAAGSLTAAPMRRLARSGAASAGRYLGLEGARACSVLDCVLPSGICAAVMRYATSVGITQSADESLHRALTAREFNDPPSWFGELHPIAVLRAAGAAAGGGGSDSLVASVREAMAEADAEEDGGGDRSRILELLSAPVRNPLGDAVLRLLGGRSSAGEPGNGVRGGQEMPAARRPFGPATRPARPAHPVQALVKAGGALVSGLGYPEWDHRAGRYREAWCLVGDFEPQHRAAPLPPAVADTALLRELARLGLTWLPHSGETFGDELDLTALVDHRARLAAGDPGEARVYRAERRTAQELRALVLLDATGSAAQRWGGQSLFEEQRRLASALTTVLDRLGLRVALYAFYSRGRQDVRFLRCKSFEERWGLLAQGRLSSVSPTGFTRLGAAIRHGTHLLEHQAGTQRRLLVVVGDGIAYDDGYEGRYAAEDSRRAIEEARPDTVVAIHAVADHRRELSLERLGGTTVKAAPGFQLVVSYNPGYQSILKDMKPSTRQRMVAIELGFPSADLERDILARETGLGESVAEDLIRLGQAVRRVQHAGLREVASTRALVSAAALIQEGLGFVDAAVAAVAGPLSDDPELRNALVGMIRTYADGR